MPTIKDVAREAGVSIATVSYVLNNKTAAISEETRRLVWEAVQRIGYTPNVTARNLRSSQSRLIGYALHDAPVDQVNPVLDQFMYALARTAESAGYHILTFTYPPDEPLPVYDDLVRTGRVDGFILGATSLDDARIEFLQKRRVPFVTFGRSNPEWDFCWVDTDGQAGVQEAVTYMAGLGHRRIALAGWPAHSLAGQFRLRGYIEGMATAGLTYLPQYIYRGEHSETSGREAMAYWMRLPADQRPSAIITMSDLMAIGVMNEAERNGLIVGRDLSVIGFDDVPMTQFLRPALTTLRQPIAQIAGCMIDLLERMLVPPERRQPIPDADRHLLLPPQLIVRESCGPYIP